MIKIINRSGLLLVLTTWLLSLSSCSSADTLELPDGAIRMILSSPELMPGKPISSQFTCDDKNISPALEWSPIPENTKSIVLIMDDPDAPGGTWDHWVVFNIPPENIGIPENFTADTEKSLTCIQGKNSWNKNEYGGPCPPGGTHRYIFRVYALDTILSLTASSNKTEVETAIKGHISGGGSLQGSYTRRTNKAP